MFAIRGSVARSRFDLALAVAWLLGAVPAHASPWRPSPGHVQVPIWPSRPPGGRHAAAAESTAYGLGPVAGRRWVQVRNVSVPTLTVYPARGRNTGVAVIVFPGGGYQLLAIDLEGTEVCDWLTSRGVTCVLLKYRVPNASPTWDPFCGCDRDTKSSMPLEDAQRAIGLVRHRAAEWHVDPHKVGVLGFSAGGHLVASVSTHFGRRMYPPVDAADRESARPDFVVALYPGHLFDYDKGGLNEDLRFTREAPPTFIVHAENDKVDGVSNSLIYYDTLKNEGVPVELHLYADGGHAFGLRKTQQPITDWPRLMERWLRTIGMVTP